MPFTGKATYSAGPSLPEIAEDVSDIIGIISPFETPLLDHLGDPRRTATSTVHEWLEDALLPNTDVINDDTISSPDSASVFDVGDVSRFRVGDQVRAGNSGEIMLVIGVTGPSLVVERGYGGTTTEELIDGQPLYIIGNAALEGDDKPDARFTNRVRKQNYTQIFTASVEVSGSQMATQSIGIADEMDYQKQERLRELLRDLENCVINGIAPAASPEGSASVRRSMNGIIPQIVTNRLQPGTDPLPDGAGPGADELTEELLNAALRHIWENSSAVIDTIVVGGAQKRRINAFIGDGRAYAPGDTAFRDMVSVYESDFGVARVLLSRWVPTNSVLLLDSSRLDVLPMSGRSFHFKPLAATGDRECGQVIGEYTLEMRNESAHALISGLAA